MKNKERKLVHLQIVAEIHRKFSALSQSCKQAVILFPNPARIRKCVQTRAEPDFDLRPEKARS